MRRLHLCPFPLINIHLLQSSVAIVLFSTSLLSTVIIFSAHGLLPTKRSSGVFNCMRIHCCTSSAGHEVQLTCRSVCKATCRSHLRRVSGGLEVFTCAQNVYFCRKNLVGNSRPLKNYRSNGEKHYIRLHPITFDYIPITFRLHSDYIRVPQTPHFVVRGNF